MSVTCILFINLADSSVRLASTIAGRLLRIRGEDELNSVTDSAPAGQARRWQVKFRLLGCLVTKRRSGGASPRVTLVR